MKPVQCTMYIHINYYSTVYLSCVITKFIILIQLIRNDNLYVTMSCNYYKFIIYYLCVQPIMNKR